jgi:hypothetical protein
MCALGAVARAEYWARVGESESRRCGCRFTARRFVGSADRALYPHSTSCVAVSSAFCFGASRLVSNRGRCTRTKSIQPCPTISCASRTVISHRLYVPRERLHRTKMSSFAPTAIGAQCVRCCMVPSEQWQSGIASSNIDMHSCSHWRMTAIEATTSGFSDHSGPNPAVRTESSGRVSYLKTRLVPRAMIAFRLRVGSRRCIIMRPLTRSTVRALRPHGSVQCSRNRHGDSRF